ncbi:hypothetical protein [Ilumatobacter sp.]
MRPGPVPRLGEHTDEINAQIAAELDAARSGADGGAGPGDLRSGGAARR